MKRIVGILVLIVVPFCGLVYYFSRPHQATCNGPQPPNSICTPVNSIELYEDYGGWKCLQVSHDDSHSGFAGTFECYSPKDQSARLYLRGGSALPSTCNWEMFLQTRNNKGIYRCGSDSNLWVSWAP